MDSPEVCFHSDPTSCRPVRLTDKINRKAEESGTFGKLRHGRMSVSEGPGATLLAFHRETDLGPTAESD